ncbi:hypothetical protein P3342_013534 [Pyrenophora teres f. teres]|nr:hypothetical protein P3342_013534 [Pyrenophora teres f. teres]
MNSYIRNFAPGEVSHEECIVKITNRNLAARIPRDAPVNERQEEQQARQAKIHALHDATAQL